MNTKYKSLENEIKSKHHELIKELNDKEIKIYFLNLLEKFYETLSTFNTSYSDYEKELNAIYELLKDSVNSSKFKFNNIENYVNYLRIETADKYVYDLTVTNYFLKRKNEIENINFYCHYLLNCYETLGELKELYLEAPSENLRKTITIIISKYDSKIKEFNIRDIERPTISLEDAFKIEYEKELEGIENIEKGKPKEALNFTLFNPMLYVLFVVLDQYDNLKNNIFNGGA